MQPDTGAPPTMSIMYHQSPVMLSEQLPHSVYSQGTGCASPHNHPLVGPCWIPLLSRELTGGTGSRWALTAQLLHYHQLWEYIAGALYLTIGK